MYMSVQILSFLFTDFLDNTIMVNASVLKIVYKEFNGETDSSDFNDDVDDPVYKIYKNENGLEGILALDSESDESEQ